MTTAIQQTPLPGVGVRYDFTTEEGLRLGVVHHHSGRRQLFLCSADDPDSARVTVELTEVEAHALVDVLGGSQIVETLAVLRQQVEGLGIDWLTVDPASAYAGKTIGDARIRTRTGVSVVAVLRGSEAHAAPGPEFRFSPGDTLVVVGTPDGIGTLTAVLRTG
ncbi:MAG: cation:proton antiporter regulatory subunit [Actinomycetota bacterium]